MYFENLWLSVVAVFQSRSLIQLLLNIDRMGNAICAGYYKFTVSGRVGYFAKIKKTNYWLFLQWLINQTFYPLDGKDHCLIAHLWEESMIAHSKNHYRRSNDVALFGLSLIVVVCCLLLAPVIWLISQIQLMLKELNKE